MKKLIFSMFILALACSVMSAQTDSTRTPAKDRLSEIENMTVKIRKHKTVRSGNDLFEFNTISHLGYGRHLVEGDAFGGKFGPSYELFVNAFDLGFNPASWFSFNAGIDLKWDRFVSKSDKIEVNADAFSLAAVAPDNINSRISVFGFSVPASVSLHFGETSIRLGAECIFNINKFNKVKSAYTASGSDFSQVTKAGEIEKFRHAYTAAIDFDGLGIYYKYCPKPLIPGSNMIEKYQTIGIVLSM